MMVEYKSQFFILTLAVIISLTVVVKLATLIETGNPLHLIAPTLAIVVGILLMTRHRLVIPWIKAWAIVEIASAILFIVSRGCQMMLETGAEQSGKDAIIQMCAAGAGIVIATTYYLLVPDYIVPRRPPAGVAPTPDVSTAAASPGTAGEGTLTREESPPSEMKIADPEG